MTRYAAFLRGVNVGGVKLRMADVAATLTAAGFAGTRTVLASGNVVFDAAGDPESLRARAEAALRADFGYAAWVLVYDIGHLQAIVDDYPFDREAPGQHSYVTFVSDRGVLDELAALDPVADERTARGDGVLYWQVPKGATLTSAVGATMGNRRYTPSTTTRNLRTLGKVLALAARG